MVVNLDSNKCTGTLITPQVVLTALHCVRDSENTPACGISLPTVTLGPAVSNPEPNNPFKSSTGQWLRRTVAVETVIDDCLGSRAQDIALLFLDAPVVGTRIARPAPLNAFNTTPVSYDWTIPNAGIAGWGRRGSDIGAVRRQGMGLANFSVHTSIDEWRLLSANPDGDDVRFGDSGGPLFHTLPDGRRQVVGVLSGYAIDSWWADVTAPAAAAWLHSRALAQTRVPRSPDWYTKHGKNPGDMWFGEADYSGFCDTARDADCDLWDNAHDNCPYVPNADQAEVFPGGPGVLCSKCPFDPKNDFDNDGVCDVDTSAPPWVRRDNCPTIANCDKADPASCQLNCNERSEVAFSSPVLGDACDPVPCPKVVLGTATRHVEGGVPNRWTGGILRGRVEQNEMLPFPVPPSRAEERPRAEGTLPATRVVAELQGLTTATRFCQRNDLLGYRCLTDPANLRNAQVDAFTTLADERQDSARVWHRIVQRVGSGLDLGRGADTTWPYTVATSTTGITRRTWNYAEDWNYWWVTPPNGVPLIPEAESTFLCADFGLVGAGTCLDGAMWHHARTPIGETEPNAGATYVGLHGGTDLPNHFVPIAPDLAFMSSKMKAIGKYRHLWWWQKLVDPLPPFLDDPSPRPHPRPLGLDDARVAHVLHDTGMGREAEEISPSLAALLGTDLLIAPMLDPETVPRNLVDTIEAAVLTADGTEVLDFVVSDDKTLRLGSELGWSVGGGAGALHAPGPREGAIAFLSSALGGVVVAGGVLPGTSTPTPSVHLFRPTLGWVGLSPSTGALVEVRAAIYSPSDGRVWVLDAKDEEHVRLVRIDPLTNQADEVGVYPWNRATHLRHMLSVDVDGGVLLTASTLLASETVRVALDATGAAVGTARLNHQFAQSVAPFAGRMEYSFVAEDEAGNTTAILREASLLTVPAFSLAELFQ